jgi:hypothetical protein
MTDPLQELGDLLTRAGLTLRLCSCAPLHLARANAPCPCSKCHTPTLRIFSDNQRHLVCWPYTLENLHATAQFLGIKRCWFHGGRRKDGDRNLNAGNAHYDVPKKRVEEIYARTERLTTREVLSIIKGGLPPR